MSDRFRTFLDLHVKAPLLVIPVDLSLPTASSNAHGGGVEFEVERGVLPGAGAVHDDHQREGDTHEEEKESRQEQVRRAERRRGGTAQTASAAATEAAATTVTGAADRVCGATRGSSGAVDSSSRLAFSSCSSFSPSPRDEHGLQRRRQQKTSSTAVVATELLVVDLGSVSLTTARLAHLRRDTDRRDPTAAAATTASSSSVSSDFFGESDDSPGSDGVRSHAASDREHWGADVEPTAVPRRRRARASSDVGREDGGRIDGEGWHANFYDVHNIDVCQVGVLLARRDGGDGGDEGVRGRGRGWSIEEGGWVASGGSMAVRNGRREAGRRWLIYPFDVKVWSLRAFA